MADQRVSNKGDEPECDEQRCPPFDGHEIFWPGGEFFKISGRQPPIGVVRICRFRCRDFGGVNHVYFYYKPVNSVVLSFKFCLVIRSST